MHRTLRKKYYDIKARDITYAIGDQVFKYSPAIKPGQTPKFLHPWLGPYEIMQIKYPTVLLRDFHQRGKEEWIHVNRLKKSKNNIKYAENYRKPQPQITSKENPHKHETPTSKHHYNLRQRI